jgi:hypothetical protein
VPVPLGYGRPVAEEPDVAGTVVAGHREDTPRSRTEPLDDRKVFGDVLEHLGTDEPVVFLLGVDVRGSRVIHDEAAAWSVPPCIVDRLIAEVGPGVGVDLLIQEIRGKLAGATADVEDAPQAIAADPIDDHRP